MARRMIGRVEIAPSLVVSVPPRYHDMTSDTGKLIRELGGMLPDLLTRVMAVMIRHSRASSECHLIIWPSSGGILESAGIPHSSEATRNTSLSKIFKPASLRRRGSTCFQCARHAANRHRRSKTSRGTGVAGVFAMHRCKKALKQSW
jgi:hypothetical protein